MLSVGLGKFIAKVIERTAAIKLVSPLDKTAMMGAQASIVQKEKILSYIKLGKEEGAEVLIGGEENKLGGDLDGGYYIKPTIFKGHNKMRIFQEEIFGPVLSILTFRTPQEAIEKANNTPFGLSAGVWSEKGSRILWATQQLRAGVIWANTFNKFDPTSPFGGYKESGWGREGGKHGLASYLKEGK